MIQAEEHSSPQRKSQLATNVALEAKERCATQTPRPHPDNVSSTNHSNLHIIVPEWIAKVAQLASNLEHLTHRVKHMDTLNTSPRSKAVSTSTTRSATSGRASRKRCVSNLTTSSTDRRDTTAHDIKREKRDTSPHESSGDPYSQKWETPAPEGKLTQDTCTTPSVRSHDS